MFDFLRDFFRPPIITESPVTARIREDLERRLAMSPQDHDRDALAADWRAVGIETDPARLSKLDHPPIEK